VKIAVTVVYALPGRQCLRHVEIEAPASIRQAIDESGLLREFPEIDLGSNRVGVFGRMAALDTPLRAGDQVEIYRPLIADPKESRRLRAARKARR
jgi:uncharacterized protein